LTRQEAAKLLWAAWRARQTDRGGGKGRHVGKHLARYLLVSLYTCTRKGAVCDAAMMPTVGRGYVNLDTGKFHRKADGAVESNKRQPTIDLPPRLLAHMRRWQRLGIAKRYLVEWNGKPVRNIRKAFERARVAAGLDDKVIPHTLRDTAVSWYLRQGVSPSVVADYAGMSEQILRRVYKHHLPGAFAPIMDASKTFGRFDQNPMFSRESPYRFRTSNG
jgi:integrase